MAEKELATTEVHSKTGGAAIGGAVAVLLVWGLSLAGVEVPAEVSVAIGTILSVAGSYVAKAV